MVSCMDQRNDKELPIRPLLQKNVRLKFVLIHCMQCNVLNLVEFSTQNKWSKVVATMT